MKCIECDKFFKGRAEGLRSGEEWSFCSQACKASYRFRQYPRIDLAEKQFPETCPVCGSPRKDSPGSRYLTYTCGGGWFQALVGTTKFIGRCNKDSIHVSAALGLEKK